jgi:F-type H+-transporting ATPase subunit gamma
MATLKELRVRIRSVRSTQKITSAMKMVAASRLRRAQEQAEATRPYALRMDRMLSSLAANLKGAANAPPLLAGTGKDSVHLLVVATSDRGLAGGFNATILRDARRAVRELQGAGKTVKILTIGRKGRDSLRRDYSRLLIDTLTEVGRPKLTFEAAQGIGEKLLARFAAGEFDVCTVIYNRFKSAIRAPRGDRALGRRGLRIRTGRGRYPGRSPAAQSGGPALHGTARERRERAGRAHDRDGQCHAQCRRHDRPSHHHL